MFCLLRLEVRFAEMFSVAKKIVVCLVQVHLCIRKSKTVHFFQPRKIFLIATMAASVSLSGVGMASSFSLIGPILAIDPLIDMSRTMLNVAGSVVNALVIDKHLGTFNAEAYKQDKN